MLATQSTDEPHRRAALEELCSCYWYPLYAYVRRSGRGADESADLTQEFFARILVREDLRSADPARRVVRSGIATCGRRAGALG